MNSMELKFFTNSESFPFFIQHGQHDRDFFLHDHKDFNELVIVLSGSATHIVNDEKYPISRGDVFVIGGDTVHGYSDLRDFHIYNIMYRPNAVNFSGLDIAKSIGFHALFNVEPHFSKGHSFQNRLKLSPEDFATIKEVADRLLQEYSSRKDGYEILVGALFMVLVVELSRLYSYDDKSTENQVINIAKAVTYIENHFIEDITISRLASIANYSERHFARLFKDTYKMTPVDYIISLRIRHASTLLSETDLPINEIAMLTGYSDNNYFSRIFRGKIGMTPSQYRLYNRSV